jgi:hypothetical protein
MKSWHYLPDSKERERLHFFRFVEGDDACELMAAANTIFPALWPVARPLSVTLLIVARSCKQPFNILYIPSLVRTWHLREVEVPAHVAVTALVKASGPSQHSEEAKHGLTPQALTDWLARAHAQQLPEGYVPILDRLCMDCTRARLLQDREPYAELASGMVTYAVPVEKREDGFWVSGPMREGKVLDPPIEVELVSDQGVQNLYISVYWSPWIEAGSAEAELLKSCLQELEKQGWEAD